MALAQQDPGRLFDGTLSVGGGCDSSRPPNLVDKSQLVWAINASLRDEYATPRPAFVRKTLVFPGDDRNDFEDGHFQGAGYFQGDDGRGYLFASIHGRIWRVNEQFRVTDVTPKKPEDPAALDRNSWLGNRAYFCQAERWMLIQDGERPCLIATQSGCRRADGDLKEVPTGCMMEYALGRLWVVLPARKSYVGGDLVYGSSGTIEEGYRDSVLKFTENDYLNEGGEFAVPLSAGRINAIRTLASMDTSTGHGPIQVLADETVFSVQVPFQREYWKNWNQPLQTVTPVPGACGAYAVQQVNGDLWYRSHDGVRSLGIARRNYGTWVNTPSSTEADRAFKGDDAMLLEYASTAAWDNRFLTTCSPYYIPNRGVVHRGIVALNFDPVSSMRFRDEPAWEGLWTGLRVLQLVSGKFGGRYRCFMFVLARGTNDIEIWEIDPDERFDDGCRRIPWALEFRSHTFDTSDTMKQMVGGDVWVDQVWGEVDFTMRYRPDQYPLWLPWNSWDVCATKTPDCETIECDPMLSMPREQYRPRMRLPLPLQECEAATAKQLRYGYEFQQRLEVEGWCRVQKLRLHALQVVEALNGECLSTATACAAIRGCTAAQNDYEYELTPCPSVTSDAPVTEIACLGEAYLLLITILTGSAPFTWTETDLPAWLTLTPSGDGSTATLTGTPPATGEDTITLHVTDSAGLALQIDIAIAVIEITTASPLVDATQGEAYTDSLEATGGDGEYLWAITSGALPTGLSLEPTTGVISGTPSGTPGDYTFTVSVEGTCEKEFTIPLLVAGPPEDGLILRLESFDFDEDADGTDVGAWNNTGTGTFTFAEAGPRKPSVDQVRTTGGHATLRFENPSHVPEWLIDNSGAHGLGSKTALEIFVVFKRDTDPSVDATDPGGDVGAPFQFNNTGIGYFGSAIPFTNGNFYENFPNSSRITITDPVPSVASWTCYNLRNSAATNTLVAYLGTTQIYNGAATFGGTWTNLYIGCSIFASTSTYSVLGNIAAIYMYDKILSSGERAQLAAFILAEWGVVAINT